MLDAFEEYFLPNLLEAGIRITLVPFEMRDLYRIYNDRALNDSIEIFYLGDDFNIEFDPTLFFIRGDG
ncbi:MAG: hypothetical protein IJ229_08590, partial [Clostridia bacterium]|nr:hypothetical protein [Clostridia bacterium]